MLSAEEIVVPFSVSRGEVKAASLVRSTLLTSSLQSLRARALEREYFSHLPAAHHAEIESAVPGTWLSIELATAHYRACDALPLSAAERIKIGMEVGERIQGSFLGTMLRVARASGLTPWTPLLQYQRLYDRHFVGGAVSIVRLGPKEARLEVVGNELAGIGYFRAAFRGVNQISCQLFCKKTYTQDIPQLCSATTLGYRISWV